MEALRKLLGNSFSLLLNRLSQSITTFILVASIARILGAYELGQYMLAFSFYYVFMTLASQGFKTLFTRELARNPSETSVYLISGTFLQFLFSIIGYLVLAIIVYFLPYSWDTSIVCYILGGAIIPFSLSNVTESIFQAQEKMHIIAISTAPIYILRVLVMILAMNLKHNIAIVAAIMVASECLIFVIEWCFIVQLVKFKWRLDWKFMWHTTKASGAFIVIEGISVLGYRLQVFILSLLGGELVVGLYGAVTQLMQPFQIISHSVVLAVFPKMSKAINSGKDSQRQITQMTIEILLMVALPLMLGLLYFGKELLILLYHEQSFAEAKFALNVFTFGLISSSFIRPLSYVLVANGLEKVNLRQVFITTILDCLISIVLVAQYKLNGAAITVIFTDYVALLIYYIESHRRLFHLNLWSTVYRPLIISLLMLPVLIILQELNFHIISVLIISSLFYFLFVSILGVYTVYNSNEEWAKLLLKRK
ncbi:membrane protein involved in the export of O-antigen and teichoic acid [Rivularia sp. PCC 7116]|uniref:oligosaccharide flippase family protein n=1 Tax=Rivularia sp. PCC 7116 TaxID=373994 RepID=UPI00029ECF6D|nr:oligosaccharide flippase family protein [Rivularia sp. PCC 7116]AFY59077.1 membrane protein involved in the export of O-antigen and teichoic acid [Rivularia sp. PCC 7116]